MKFVLIVIFSLWKEYSPFYPSRYLYHQCLSPLLLWVHISIRAWCTPLCDKGCQWLATGRWFFPGPSVSPTNKTDSHDITEILLKVAINTTKKKPKQTCNTNGMQVIVWWTCWSTVLYYGVMVDLTVRSGIRYWFAQYLILLRKVFLFVCLFFFS